MTTPAGATPTYAIPWPGDTNAADAPDGHQDQALKVEDQLGKNTFTFAKLFESEFQYLDQVPAETWTPFSQSFTLNKPALVTMEAHIYAQTRGAQAGNMYFAIDGGDVRNLQWHTQGAWWATQRGMAQRWLPAGVHTFQVRHIVQWVVAQTANVVLINFTMSALYYGGS